MRIRRVAGLLLTLTLLASALPHPAQADAGNTLFETVGRPTQSNFAAWRDADKKHLRDLYNGLSAGKGYPTLYSEWRSLQHLVAGYSDSQYNVDPTTGLHIFAAPTTGMLLAIGDAMRAREKILSTLSDEEHNGLAWAPPPLDSVYPTFGHATPDSVLPADGQFADPSLYANPGTLIDTIADMEKNGVPTSLFDNAALIITPFGFASLDDGGWMTAEGPFAAWLSSQRATNHPVGTLIHLTGHYALQNFFGATPKAAPDNWNWYLNLRGSPGKPQTFVTDDAWANLTTENWAEDFRLAFGTGQIDSYPSRTSFKTPKSNINEAFRRKVADIMTSGGTPFSFLTAQISDGDLNASTLYGLPINRLLTDKHVLNVSGTVSMPGGGRPQVTVYSRQGPKDAWTPTGGGLSANTQGQFSFPLNLAQGSYDLQLQANIPGQTGKAVATFHVTVISKTVAGESNSSSELTDIRSHWAQDDINAMIELGAVSGYPDHTFRPDAPISRGEFFKILITALEGSNLMQPMVSVMDQPLYDNNEYKSSWARTYVDQAYLKQFFNSSEYFPTFLPGDPISRQEMARLMGGVLENLGGDFGDVTLMSRFTDQADFEDWRLAPISIAVKDGVITGYPDLTFRPRSTATRAETCVMLNRLIKELKALAAQAPTLQFGGGSMSGGQ